MSGDGQEFSESEEAWIVISAQQGDGEAFRRLVNRYDRRLLYFIRRILGETEEAFDVLQTVWLAVHRKLPSLKSPAAFRVWLYRIAHDQAVSQLRMAIRQEVILDEVRASKDIEQAGEDEAFENAEWVHRALNDLSLDHRRVLTLFFLEEMRIDDIAEVLNCPAGTVKSRLHHAKSALRRRIEESDHD